METINHHEFANDGSPCRHCGTTLPQASAGFSCVNRKVPERTDHVRLRPTEDIDVIYARIQELRAEREAAIARGDDDG